MKHNIFVFDIDGTLANIEHRKHLIESKPKNWNKFFKDGIKDLPILPVAEILCQLADNNRSEFNPSKIILATGRPEKYRQLTLDWISENIINLDFIEKLYMRPDKDYRSDCIVKVEQSQMIEEKYGKIMMWFDDRAPVIQALRGHGVFVVDVNQMQKLDVDGY